MSASTQIWFGTESGNSERLARIAHDSCQQLGLDAELVDMAQAEMEHLNDLKYLMMVISTNGDGDMPLNAETVWEEAQEAQLTFSDLQYGVLALGDSSYDYYCQAGVDWDKYLIRARARPFNKRKDVDTDYYEPGLAWIKESLVKLTGKTVEEVDTAVATVLSGASDDMEEEGYNHNNPWIAKIVDKKDLTAAASSKIVRHYALDLTGSGIHYKPGDCIEVLPVNSEKQVDELIDLMAWDAEDTITFEEQTYNLRDALINKLEIRQPTLKLLKLLAGRSDDIPYQDLIAKGKKQDIEDYTYGKDVYSLVKLHTKPLINKTGISAFIEKISSGQQPVYPKFEPQIFINYLKPLHARAYSIASSQSAYPNEVHLTIADVVYKEDGREQKGACSTYLGERIANGDTVKCWPLPNRYFAVPEDGNKSVIMVGPGTGIAPFVGFLQERKARGDSGKNWLFFGDREKANDFLYQEELEAHQASGLLTKLDLAFSRDQEEKVYVQHRMQENGAEIFNWLEEGATFCICGDARSMAADVENTLLTIIEQGKSCDRKGAEAYIKQMKRENRYLKDVY